MSGIGKRFLEGPATTMGIAAGHRFLLAIGATYRLRFTGRESVDTARRSGTAILYAFSHGNLLPLVYAYRNRDVRVLVSDSRDGEILTRVVRNMGYDAARGSSTRGGGKGALRLARMGREGYDLAMTPDGPRGPLGSVQPGIVFIAARSGCPIVPLGVAADRAWRMRSWDRFLVPKPGARIVVNAQGAIRVDRDADEQAIADRVEEALARAAVIAQEHLDAERLPAGTTRVPA